MASATTPLRFFLFPRLGGGAELSRCVFSVWISRFGLLFFFPLLGIVEDGTAYFGPLFFPEFNRRRGGGPQIPLHRRGVLKHYIFPLPPFLLFFCSSFQPTLPTGCGDEQAPQPPPSLSDDQLPVAATCQLNLKTRTLYLFPANHGEDAEVKYSTPSRSFCSTTAPPLFVAGLPVLTRQQVTFVPSQYQSPCSKSSSPTTLAPASKGARASPTDKNSCPIPPPRFLAVRVGLPDFFLPGTRSTPLSFPPLFLVLLRRVSSGCA